MSLFAYNNQTKHLSGAGKTQFLLSLLLGAQLPAPHGVSRSAIYISTESSLPTTRLAQMLRDNSQLQGEEGVPKPSLDRIVGIMTPDLESQDHILRFQLPVAIQRFNVGLVVIDSITANFRAEFDREGPNGTPAQIGKKNGINMAKRCDFSFPPVFLSFHLFS
jgi:DNA repair protein RAD57